MSDLARRSPLVHKHRFRTCLLSFLAAPGLLGISTAPPEVFAQTSNENPPGILITTSQHGVRFMTGGIGSSEREVMKMWGGRYGLKLIFAESSGHFLSSVRVVIQNQTENEILNILSNGPWLYVALVPGRYRVRATFDGVTQEISDLRIMEQARTVRFIHWDLDEATEPKKEE